MGCKQDDNNYGQAGWSCSWALHLYLAQRQGTGGCWACQAMSSLRNIKSKVVTLSFGDFLMPDSLNKLHPMSWVRSWVKSLASRPRTANRWRNGLRATEILIAAPEKLECNFQRKQGIMLNRAGPSDEQRAVVISRACGDLKRESIAIPAPAILISLFPVEKVLPWWKMRP